MLDCFALVRRFCGDRRSSTVVRARQRVALTLVGGLFLAIGLAPTSARGQHVVSATQKVSSTEGEFDGVLENSTFFGNAICRIGDLDDDGIPEIAVGQVSADDGSDGAGAVWILFMESDGTIKDQQKISATDGEFDGELDEDDGFGSACAPLGDLDGDGVRDLAVGAVGDDDGGFARGAVWILFLADDGTVSDYQKISDTDGDFDGDLDNNDELGSSLASIGDLDGDGVTDLVVGARLDDDESPNAGAVWVLFLNEDGEVSDHQKISDLEGDFDGEITSGDQFGVSVASIGDLNLDGVTDIVVGALNDDDEGSDKGAVWILYLNDDGTVSDYTKISARSGRFDGELEPFDLFGASVLGFKHRLLMVGAPGDDDGGANQGAVWILSLRANGSVDSHQKVSAAEGGFKGGLGAGDQFGRSLAALGDLNNDGISDFASGAVLDDDGGSNRGAIYVAFLGHPFLRGDVDGNGSVSPLTDALHLLQFAFQSGADLPCLDAADSDDSGAVHGIIDSLFLLQYGFQNGPLPSEPGIEACGSDATDDTLGCAGDACEED